jgi:hypothetical protein
MGVDLAAAFNRSSSIAATSWPSDRRAAEASPRKAFNPRINISR